MRKKKWIILLSVIAVLVVIRIALPVIIKGVVNKSLRDLSGYTGHIRDIDLRIIRGAYAIDSLKIYNTGEDSLPVSFVEIPRIDFSVSWGALFRGAVAGEVIIEDPQLNFAVGYDEKAKKKIDQFGPDTSWTEKIKDLMPLKLNRFEIINGTISYRDFTTNPELNLYITGLDVLATNLSNIERNDNSLPSGLLVNGQSLGEGVLNIEAGLNILREIPDLDLEMKFEEIKLVALNDFFRTYTKTDVERGTISLYTEVAINDGNIGGYLKVIIENLKTARWDEGEGKFFQKIWESAVGGITEIFENQPKDQIATEVPLNGRIENTDVDVITAILEVLKNAFVEALKKGIEDTITFPESATDGPGGKRRKNKQEE